MKFRERNKFFNDLKRYFWDDPFLYRHGPNGLIRRCVAEHEMKAIIKSCHDSPYGGHHTGSRTAAKILQSRFY